MSTFSTVLARQMATYKSREEGWIIPDAVDPGEFIAGLVDTDGSIEGSFPAIWQADNGNLDRVVPLVESLGIEPRMGKYVATSPSRQGRAVMRFSGRKNVLRFAECVQLRHPRKKQAMAILAERRRRGR